MKQSGKRLNDDSVNHEENRHSSVQNCPPDKRIKQENQFQKSSNNRFRKNYNSRIVRNSKKRFQKGSNNRFQRNYKSRVVQNFQSRFQDDHSNEMQNDKTQETILYYSNIYRSLRKGFKEGSKEMFSQNVLKESKHQEVEICCEKSSSHCIEALLPLCNDNQTMERFMAAFANQKEKVCTNPFASHIMEILINYALQNLKNWNPDFTFDDDKNTKLITSSLVWLTDLADYIHENFEICLKNNFACHVLCTLVRALGGDLSDQHTFMSKHSKQYKQTFYESYADDTFKQSLYFQPVVLEKIPKILLKSLKRLAKAMISYISLEEDQSSMINSSIATVFEALLLVLKKRYPKYSKKLIMHISDHILKEKDINNIPTAFQHKSCSFIVEEIFKAADEEVHHFFWQENIANCLDKLVVDPVGNFIVQRAFETVTNTNHFETMCESIWKLFDEILNSKHFGVFLSIANACIRLKVQQAQFMTNIMECLHCIDSAEKKLLLIPLLLGFQKYEQYNSATKISICLQGSLISQAILKFLKPVQAIMSILNMEPSALVLLASDVKGCHVLNSYFAASSNVGEKQKEKLLNHLKPVLKDLMCDRDGSLTLCRIWTQLSIKQKENIMKEIVKIQGTVTLNESGKLILKKLGIFHYKNHYDQWKQFQNNLSAKNHK